MSSIQSQIARFKDLKARWLEYRKDIAEPERYCQIKGDLYLVRNAGYDGNPPISSWPTILIDADEGMMAALEHYFLCRCWVATGVYPVWQMRAMNFVYDMGKLAGVSPRHNPKKPTTPLTALQMAAQEAGIQDGEKDIKTSRKTAPLIGIPPKYW
jgi:hypothetical protein